MRTFPRNGFSVQQPCREYGSPLRSATQLGRQQFLRDRGIYLKLGTPCVTFVSPRCLCGPPAPSHAYAFASALPQRPADRPQTAEPDNYGAVTLSDIFQAMLTTSPKAQCTCPTLCAPVLAASSTHSVPVLAVSSTRVVSPSPLRSNVIP